MAFRVTYKVYKYYAKNDDRMQDLSKQIFEMFILHKMKRGFSVNIRPFAMFYI